MSKERAATAGNVERRSSVCPLDCPDRCSLDVTIESGRVVGIGGSRVNPVTGGFICSKVRRFHRRLYGPDRILYPHRRTGPKGSGTFERISWNEAVAEIASRLGSIVRESGGEAVLPFFYGGSNGLLTQGSIDAHFFRRLGASRLERTLCAASTSAALKALYGKMPGVAFEDYPEARFILLWGANPAHSNIHLMPSLKEARRRGARVAVVDPRRILGRDLVDQHVQPFPGTDGVLALAMICHWRRSGGIATEFLERHARSWAELLEYAEHFSPERAAAVARVEPVEIVRLADSYAAAWPALLRCGWGLERNRNGLASVAAVLSLPAVAGKFGVRGGGYTLSNNSAVKVDDAVLAGVPEIRTRTLNMSRLGRHLVEPLEPPVRALFVYNCNPAATLPAHDLVLEGLRREDLYTVVHDQVWTDTARHADVVLPATTFLEHMELSRSYGSYGLHFSDAAVPARGEAKPNAELFRLLGKAMGWHDGMFAETQEQLLERAVSAIAGPVAAGSLSSSRMRTSNYVGMDFPGPTPVQFATVFPGTADGKIDLWPSSLGPEPYRYIEEAGSAEHPLALISPASSRSISSTLAEFNLTDVKLEMNPQDAAEGGIVDGDTVRAFNALGEVHCRAAIDGRLRRGVVSLAKGIWKRATLNGAIGNSLVPDHVTPVSGGACFNDARVQVQRLETASRGARVGDGEGKWRP